MPDRKLVELGGTAHPGKYIVEASVRRGAIYNVPNGFMGEVVVAHYLAEGGGIEVAIRLQANAARFGELA